MLGRIFRGIATRPAGDSVMPLLTVSGRRVQTTTQTSVTRRFLTRSSKWMSGRRPASDGPWSIQEPVLCCDLRTSLHFLFLPLPVRWRQGNLRFPLKHTYHGSPGSDCAITTSCFPRVNRRVKLPTEFLAARRPLLSAAGKHGRCETLSQSGAGGIGGLIRTNLDCGQCRKAFPRLGARWRKNPSGGWQLWRASHSP